MSCSTVTTRLRGHVEREPIRPAIGHASERIVRDLLTCNPEFKEVAVVGLGYVGLPTAATFAARGLEVIGVDINQSAVETINAGRAHIAEPDLDMVLSAAVTPASCAR